jgi:L1 cell adhesion molecule like protein
MVKYFADRFQKKFKSDLRQSPRALRALLTACERAKRTHSTAATASIICASLDGGQDFMDNISRVMFEHLNDELFCPTMTPAVQVPREANMAKGDVTSSLLVVRPGFRVFSSCFRTSSTGSSRAAVSTLTRRLRPVLWFRQRS